MAPLGTKSLVHEIKTGCRTRDLHGIEGWYLGHASNCYHCHCCYIPKTWAERIARTVEFFPCNNKMLFTSSTEASTNSAQDLIQFIQNPNTGSPLPPISNTQLEALSILEDIFGHEKTPANTARLMKVSKPPNTSSQFTRVPGPSNTSK